MGRGGGSRSHNFFVFFFLTIFCTQSSKNAMKHMMLSFKMKGDVYLTISWCYGSKNILWVQLVFGLFGLNKIVDFGGPKWHLDSKMYKYYIFYWFAILALSSNVVTSWASYWFFLFILDILGVFVPKGKIDPKCHKNWFKTDWKDQQVGPPNIFLKIMLETFLGHPVVRVSNRGEEENEWMRVCWMRRL